MSKKAECRVARRLAASPDDGVASVNVPSPSLRHSVLRPRSAGDEFGWMLPFTKRSLSPSPS